jgi:hypothetical protein
MTSLFRIVAALAVLCFPGAAISQVSTAPTPRVSQPGVATGPDPRPPTAAEVARSPARTEAATAGAPSETVPPVPAAPRKEVRSAMTDGNARDAVEKAYGACSNPSACAAAVRKASALFDVNSKGLTAAVPVANCNNPASPCFASYWRRQGVDLKALADASGNSQDLRRVTKRSQNVAGEEILVAVVGGLQTFLVDRAKGEALNYAVAQLKGKLCTKYSSYLPTTCALLSEKDLELDDATLLSFKRTLQDDFALLPLVIFQQLPPAKNADEAALRLFTLSGLNTLVAVATSSLPPKSIPARWVQENKDGYAKLTMKLTCELGGRAMPGACWALLMPELGKAAVDLGGDWAPENVAVAIEQAAISFCQTYGPLGKQENGACLLTDPDQFETVLSNFQELGLATARFAELQQSIDRLAKQGTPPAEIAARLLPEYAGAFELWGAAFKKVLPAGEALDANVKRVAVALRAIDAAAARDYPTFVATVADAVRPGQPFADVIPLPTQVIEGLSFGARLAIAKTPADAKKVFEDAAAPLGSYKVKYDRETYTFTVNAFVGPFVGGGLRFKSEARTKSTLAFRPLSAPLGIDWTAPSWKLAHVGLMLSVIDPFAAGTIDSNSKAAELDWGAIFTPGLFLRVGIGGSPFTVLVGGAAQPLAKSSDTCTTSNGATPCWKGQLQFGGAVAIDVPLVVLH